MANEVQLQTSQLDPDNVPVSNIQLPRGFSTKAKVVKIHDGDTCHVHIYYDEKLYRIVCRLADIDTPELGQRNSLIARDYLAHLCTGGGENSFIQASSRYTEPQLQDLLDANQSLVYATFDGRDKYKRALVTLQHADNSAKSFNSMLLEKGYAKPYKK